MGSCLGTFKAQHGSEKAKAIASVSVSPPPLYPPKSLRGSRLKKNHASIFGSNTKSVH